MTSEYRHPLHVAANKKLGDYFKSSSGDRGKEVLLRACETSDDCLALARALSRDGSVDVPLFSSNDLQICRKHARQALERAIGDGLSLGHMIRGLSSPACDKLDQNPDLNDRADLKELYKLNDVFRALHCNLLKCKTDKAQRYAMLAAAGHFIHDSMTDGLEDTLAALFNTGHLTQTNVNVTVLMQGPPALLYEVGQYMTVTKFNGFQPIKPVRETLAEAVALCRRCGLDELQIMQAVAEELQK